MSKRISSASLPELRLPPRRPGTEWERRVRASGWVLVAGVDEAGRGPLAGPVVAGAVILPPRGRFPGVQDSKRLSATDRESAYDLITRKAVAWSVAVVEVEQIDQINILRATHAAMARALHALDPAPDGALVDGLPVTGLPCPHQAVVSGDALCISIAAASILAKVTRDRLMVELDACFPGYGFAQHKGYGTREHLKALRDLGPAPCHRRSFRPVAELCGLEGAVGSPPILPLFEDMLPGKAGG